MNKQANARAHASIYCKCQSIERPEITISHQLLCQWKRNGWIHLIHFTIAIPDAIQFKMPRLCFSHLRFIAYHKMIRSIHRPISSLLILNRANIFIASTILSGIYVLCVCVYKRAIENEKEIENGRLYLCSRCVVFFSVLLKCNVSLTEFYTANEENLIKRTENLV